MFETKDLKKRKDCQIEGGWKGNRSRGKVKSRKIGWVFHTVESRLFGFLLFYRAFFPCTISFSNLSVNRVSHWKYRPFSDYNA